MAAQPSINKDRAAGASAAPRVGRQRSTQATRPGVTRKRRAPQVGRQNETSSPKHPAPPMRRDVARPTATPPIPPRKPRYLGSPSDASRPAIESLPTAGTPPLQAASDATQRSNQAAAQRRDARTTPPQAQQHPASRTAAAIPLRPTRRPQRRRYKTGRVRRSDATRAPPERKNPGARGGQGFAGRLSKESRRNATPSPSSLARVRRRSRSNRARRGRPSPNRRCSCSSSPRVRCHTACG